MVGLPSTYNCPFGPIFVSAPVAIEASVVSDAAAITKTVLFIE
jgi:hypothetical protein